MKQIVMAVAFATGVIAGSGVLAQQDTKTNVAGGVTVKVTPRVLVANAATWEFLVTLETHAGELADDLSKTAVIVDAAGSRRLPTSWSSPGSDGHHREGVLRFEAIKPPPAMIELQIQRPGEKAPRSFRWELR